MRSGEGGGGGEEVGVMCMCMCTCMYIHGDLFCIALVGCMLKGKDHGYGVYGGRSGRQTAKSQLLSIRYPLRYTRRFFFPLDPTPYQNVCTCLQHFDSLLQLGFLVVNSLNTRRETDRARTPFHLRLPRNEKCRFKQLYSSYAYPILLSPAEVLHLHPHSVSM